jgi:uncharacterized UBP type Zn finger protein
VELAVSWLFENPEKSMEPFVPDSGSSETCDDIVIGSPKYELHAIIAHKGTSTACGHYVAYVKHKEKGWVLFNDEKVVSVADSKDSSALSGISGTDMGYIYIWKQVSN